MHYVDNYVDKSEVINRLWISFVDKFFVTGIQSNQKSNFIYNVQYYMLYNIVRHTVSKSFRIVYKIMTII